MFQSATYAVFTDQSTQSYCTVLVGHGHFICKVSEPSLWEQKTYAHFKIISKPNMSYCSATW